MNSEISRMKELRRSLTFGNGFYVDSPLLTHPSYLLFASIFCICEIVEATVRQRFPQQVRFHGAKLSTYLFSVPISTRLGQVNRLLLIDILIISFVTVIYY